jgi:predicted Zn-dependent protease
LLLSGNDPQDAIVLLETAANSPNSDPRFHFHLALALQKKNDLSSARERLAEARRLKLESQVLTEADSKLLRELEAALAPAPPANGKPTPSS